MRFRPSILLLFPAALLFFCAAFRLPAPSRPAPEYGSAVCNTVRAMLQDDTQEAVPPRMQPGAWITDDRLLEDCVRLNDAYRKVAERQGIRFVDATDWDIEVTFDGVHYSEKGHQTFAEQLFLSLSCSFEVKT